VKLACSACCVLDVGCEFCVNTLFGTPVGTVDPARQVTLEQVHGEAPRVLKSHIKVGESSRTKPRVTTRILLNKWQRQQEKERYQKQRHEEERRRFEEEARRKELERYTWEQERAH
jgi:hypothetical protein